MQFLLIVSLCTYSFDAIIFKTCMVAMHVNGQIKLRLCFVRIHAAQIVYTWVRDEGHHMHEANLLSSNFSVIQLQISSKFQHMKLTMHIN